MIFQMNVVAKIKADVLKEMLLMLTAVGAMI